MAVKRAYGSRGADALNYHAAALRGALPRLTADDLRDTPAGRDLMAQTLRVAAQVAVSEEEGVPWLSNGDRAAVAAWLDDLAESIHPGSPDAAKEADQ